MFNPLLEHHLAELGIEPEAAPAGEQWQKLLAKISDIYTDYQSAELDLRQSEMLYEDLYNSTWRQTQELSLLVRVREALANKIQFNDVIRTVVEATAEAFGYALVTIYLLRDDVLYLQHQVGYEKTIAQMPVTKGIMGRVARTGESAFVEDCRLDADFIGAIDGLVSEVCVPIRSSKQMIGVLNVETRAPQRLSANDLDLMSSLSEHIGLALERAELYSAVQESNQKYHMVVDNINEVIFQVDVNGYLTFLNPAWYKLSGHTVESSLGKHFTNFIVPGAIDALTQMQHLLTSSQRSETRFQSMLLKPDGSGVPVEARIQRTYTPDGQFMGLGGTAFDISDRLQAEQHAREAQLMARVQEAISSKLGLKDMIRSIVEVTAETFGYELVSAYLVEGDKLHLQHQVGYDTVIPKFPITKGVAGRVVRTQKPVLVEDAAADPDFLFAFPGLSSEICVPLINDGQTTGVMIVEARDGKRLTQNDLQMLIVLSEHLSVAVERARLYTAVQESHQKYQRVVDNVHEIIFQTDLKGNLIFLNKAWERITGYKVAESMGKAFAQFIPPEYFDFIQESSLSLIRGEQQQSRFQTELLHRNLAAIPVEAHLQCIYDVEGRLVGVGGTTTDISRRVEAEKREKERGLLVQVRAAISSQLDLKATIRTIVEATASAFQYDLVGVYLLQGSRLHLQYQVGYELIYGCSNEVVDASTGCIGRVARTGIPFLVEDTGKDPDFVGDPQSAISGVYVPLLHKGNVIGVMNVEAKLRRLNESDLNMMIALSEHVSIAVERAQLYTAVVESNQRYQMVVDNVHEVIFQLDPKGIMVFLNQSWVELSGYALEYSIGKHFSSFMPPDDVRKAEALGELLYAGQQEDVRYQHSLVRVDGTLVPLEVRMQLVHSPTGELVGIGGTAIDIRERLQAEQQAVNLLLQTRTVDMLRSFLSNVSHDLRTPLSIMNTSLYLLRRKMGDDANGNRYLEALDKQTEHMQHIIEDMLDISKLDDENTQLSLMRVDINGLINDLLVTLNAGAVAKRQQLTFAPQTDQSIILSDQTMLGKAITNVIKNAIQYTPEDGEITITTTNGSDSVFSIQVQDSGIGINADILPMIFDRFYKADTARPTDQGGMGLGLTIARKIIELHGGTISAVSRPGKGSTFTIVLPMGEYRGAD